MNRKHLLLLSLLALIFTSVLYAKDQPAQVIVWPESGTPVLRFTFGKFREIGSNGNQHTYTTDTTAENLWGKAIPGATFSLYLFDKNKTRIGEGIISLSNVRPGETIKFGTSISASGSPASLSVFAISLPHELQSYLPPRTITVTVNSVPQGAVVKVDGIEAGTTPKIVAVAPGKHLLEFSKEGFTPGKFPLEIGPDDVSGGSVSYELGSSVHDTVELRDGSVINGDLESISRMDVVVRVGGTLQHLNRNQVKRILLVERDTPAQ